MKQNVINNLLYTSINQRRIVIEYRSGFLVHLTFHKKKEKSIKPAHAEMTYMVV